MWEAINLNIDSIKAKSLEKLINLRSDCQFNIDRIDFKPNVCVFAAGSLGRLEIADSSDLDLFFVLTDKIDESQNNSNSFIPSNLQIYTFFNAIYEMYKKHNYPEPSSGGKYLEFINVSELFRIGSREEDFKNGFTTRMLLLLESKYIYNEKKYNEIIEEILDAYFVDFDDHSDNFAPLFLMNDIYRYWYTLTMNYEFRRDKADDINKKYWKRLKLKYARMLTCYSMIACLYKPNIQKKDIKNFVDMTPMERIESVNQFVCGIENEIDEIKNSYSWFLELKRESSDWWNKNENKTKAFSNAELFHEILIHRFMKKVELANPKLKNKTEIF